MKNRAIGTEGAEQRERCLTTRGYQVGMSQRSVLGEMNNSSGAGVLLGGRAEQQNWSEQGAGLFPLLGPVLFCPCESRCGLVFVYDRSYDAEEERSGNRKGNVRR